jgi:hypothetical protein
VSVPARQPLGRAASARIRCRRPAQHRQRPAASAERLVLRRLLRGSSGRPRCGSVLPRGKRDRPCGGLPACRCPATLPRPAGVVVRSARGKRDVERRSTSWSADGGLLYPSLPGCHRPGAFLNGTAKVALALAVGAGSHLLSFPRRDGRLGSHKSLFHPLLRGRK